ncbi:MAG TPA: adenosylcobinamide-GDP ribazoletransferase [Xanthobacteraceae bacterium]|nr:adenosylcobinamide-GDP ribazoletransferase [Xanthobacteraceae bacterium]
MPLPSFLRDLPAALRFLTRLPVPVLSFEHEPEGPPDINRLAPALPVVGLLVGLCGALAFLAAMALGLGSFIAATLAFGITAAITGAFHEDGLADTADGLGGMDRARRLAIMRDSRIGTFGAIALILAFALRIGAVEGLSQTGLLAASSGLVAAAVAARMGGLWLLYALPPARADGLAEAAGRPDIAAVRTAFLVCAVIAAALVAPTLGLTPLAGAAAAGAASAFGVQRLAERVFGGQTGDLAGTATQAVEIAFLLGLLIFAPHP